jgi:TrmH family RNA methyltransferase
MISVILIEPGSSGNVGSIARIMENFGFKELILVKPKCNHLDEQGIMFAKSAGKTLKAAKVVSLEFLKNFDTLIATTSRLGSDYNIPRSPLNPQQLAEKLAGVKGKIGLVFGRESSGLNNKEIALCDFTVTIQTSTKYPAMNLAQAVNVVLYEIYKKKGRNKIGAGIKLATKKEKDILLRKVFDKLNKTNFSTQEKRETQKTLWKKLVGKSFLTKRELFALHGFFSKLK